MHEKSHRSTCFPAFQGLLAIVSHRGMAWTQGPLRLHCSPGGAARAPDGEVTWAQRVPLRASTFCLMYGSAIDYWFS